MMLCKKMDKDKLKAFVNLTGDDWIAEVKYDGDRIQLKYVPGRPVELITRGTKNNVAFRYPELKGFECDKPVVLDGEMCVMRDGLSVFYGGIDQRSHKQNSRDIREVLETHPVTYVVFDVLEVDGVDVTGKPWVERRKLLEGLEIESDSVLITQPEEDIVGLWEKEKKRGGEGIIIKRKDSEYRRDSRSSLWRKVKNVKEADIRVNSFEENPKGIRVENTTGIACQVAGEQSREVKRKLEENGSVRITINHLGENKSGKYRQPTFKKLVR